MNRHLYLRIVTALVVVTFLAGCSVFAPSLRSELANKGPMLLSDKNPYLAPNLLLSKEIERSSALKGFIEHRGSPDTIELKQNLIPGDYTLFLIYSKDMERFTLTEYGADWLIRGPEPTQTQALEGMGEAALITPTEPTEPKEIESELTAPVQQTDDSTKKNSDEPSTKPSVKDNVKQSRSKRAKLAKLPSKLTVDAQKKKKQGGATDSGHAPEVQVHSLAATHVEDVVHTVASDDESLGSISSTYTGSRKNAQKIARINGLTSPTLVVGQTIRIPRYLISESPKR